MDSVHQFYMTLNKVQGNPDLLNGAGKVGRDGALLRTSNSNVACDKKEEPDKKDDKPEVRVKIKDPFKRLRAIYNKLPKA